MKVSIPKFQVNGLMIEALRRKVRVKDVHKQSPIEVTNIETIQAARPEDVKIEHTPVDKMTRQQLRQLGLKEIERKLKAMYPGAGRRLIRKYAQWKMNEAWAGRDKEGVAKAIREQDAKGVGLAIRGLK